MIASVTNLETDMKLEFLSYGDQRFSESRRRIENEALDLDFFTDIKIHTDLTISELKQYKDAISNKEFANIFSRKRGGGYWMWKPLIVYEELLKLNENDILYYADSGCTIPNKPITITKLKQYKEIVQKHKSGILSFENPNIESTWTKGDVFKHFNAINNQDIFNTNQIAANRLVIKKCDKSMEAVKLWWETAKHHPHLFSDQQSKTPNFENFRENRHDQSIWSMICKNFNVSKLSLASAVIKLTRIRQ